MSISLKKEINLEDIMLIERSQSQRTNTYDSTYMRYLELIFIETENRMGGCQGLEGGGVMSCCCLMSVEFQFGKRKVL